MKNLNYFVKNIHYVKVDLDKKLNQTEKTSETDTLTEENIKLFQIYMKKI